MVGGSSVLFRGVRWGKRVALHLSGVLDDETRELAEDGQAVPVLVEAGGEAVGALLLTYNGSDLVALAVAGRVAGGRLLPDLLAYVESIGRGVGAARIACRTRRPGLVRRLVRSDPRWRVDLVSENPWCVDVSREV